MNRRLPALVALLSALLLPGASVEAGWAVLNHNSDTITSGQARCVLAPTTAGNRLRIHRIRITRSGSTDVSHRFVFATTEDAAGDTESIASCTLPGCRQVLTTEGLREGRSYDFDGLDLLGPPNGRLYVQEEAHAGSETVTIEVFYTET